MQIPDALFLIAGSGDYPRLVLEGARSAGVRRVSMAAFEGETDPAIARSADDVAWMRVGQLGRLTEAARKSGATHAIMAGQIAPSNLFNLRPDFRALVLLAKLRERNAETLFGAVAGELESAGVQLLPATSFLESHVAGPGHLAGPRPKQRLVDDLQFGLRIAKETSRLDIGQTVVVRNGTVLAVEAFEGTNEAIRRGGALGRGGASVVKVSKPGQDMRFDVPVVGTRTLEVAAEAGVAAIGVESGSTILLDRPRVEAMATEKRITIYGL
ncbi:MAG: UDP-2,3-diacylglucosamine diphosphatase LpxI [Terrimicrobiaceae bacterium]|nr:UDP-2,3-diacylglucosamine diphosphatase LpxI [Terrimicrobiaceae bacterium]